MSERLLRWELYSSFLVSKKSLPGSSVYWSPAITMLLKKSSAGLCSLIG
jgi:hypothetical protein